MLRIIPVVAMVLLLMTCGGGPDRAVLVSTPAELQTAISQSKPGDQIVMANAVWRDVQIRFEAMGSAEAPIVLRAETPGLVTLEGRSSLELAGKYLIVDGLYFKNGFTPGKSVINFRIDKERFANHSRVINCVIEDYSQLDRYTPDHWVEFWGRHNSLENSTLLGKSNQGPTIRVYLKGNEHIRNYHRIANNYFGPRPRKGGPRAETMQIGDSGTSMTPSYVMVSSNFFDRCNGEVEVISSKSNFNGFHNNIFYKCEGSLVMRHGNYCVIDGNYFIGDENSEFNGGIRIINTGHWVTNNYFYKIRGAEFRSPLAVMNGIPKSPLNRYNQVTDVVVAYNTWVDCRSPWQFSVGANVDQKDVLPASEIRSARPVRTVLANNIIYNTEPDPLPVKAYDKVDGVDFQKNYIHNPGGPEAEGLIPVDLNMVSMGEWLHVPEEEQEVDFSDIYEGFDFDNILRDIAGNSRVGRNSVGAQVIGGAIPQPVIDGSLYGAHWYDANPASPPAEIWTAEDPLGLEAVLAKANDGDIVELTAPEYFVAQTIIVDKSLTVRVADPDDYCRIEFGGAAGSPLFQMAPKSRLVLEGLTLIGDGKQQAFASQPVHATPPFDLWVKESEIRGFSEVVYAYKGAFADTISFAESIIADCDRGIVLAAETNDKGDYNAEFVYIRNCQFENVDRDVIHYYRGGYDESTIGGNLLVENSHFTNCGDEEESDILLKTRGIINVNLRNNSFERNPIKLVALLWGSKNNQHSNNELRRSGEIRVEDQLKQTLMY